MVEQLTGMDTAFLAMETPELPMHILGVVLLDPQRGNGFSTERLRRVLRERLPLVPSLRRRPISPPLGLDRPYWHYVEHLDVEDHLHETTLSERGDLVALGEVAGEIAAEPLDRSKPLWSMHVVHGLDGGRVALVTKIHHSSMYGVGSLDALAGLMDLDATGRAAVELREPELPRSPSRREVLQRTVLRQVTWPVPVARFAATSGRQALDGIRKAAELRSGQGELTIPFTGPRDGVSGPLTIRRTTAFGALPLQMAKDVKNAAGVKMNDVVLATLSAALREHLLARGAAPDRPLVAVCPVNAGAGVAEGTNKVGAMFVALPVHDLDPHEPRELLSRLGASSASAKKLVSDVGVHLVADLVDLIPPALMSVGMRLLRDLRLTSLAPPPVNLTVSNVMGPPIALFLAGARVEGIYPLGPLIDNTGLNVTILSTGDNLDVGINACPDVVGDPWPIVAAMSGALAQMHEALVGTGTGS